MEFNPTTKEIEIFDQIYDYLKNFNEQNPLNLRNKISQSSTWEDVWQIIKQTVMENPNIKGNKIDVLNNITWTVWGFGSDKQRIKTSIWKDQKFYGSYKDFIITFGQRRKTPRIYFKNISSTYSSFDYIVRVFQNFTPEKLFDFNKQLDILSTWNDVWSYIKDILVKSDEHGIVSRTFDNIEWSLDNKNYSPNDLQKKATLESSNVTFNSFFKKTFYLKNKLKPDFPDSVIFFGGNIQSLENTYEEIISVIKTYNSLTNAIDTQKIIHDLSTWVDAWAILSENIKNNQKFLYRKTHLFKNLEWSVYGINFDDIGAKNRTTFQQDNMNMSGDYRQFKFRPKFNLDNVINIDIYFKNFTSIQMRKIDILKFINKYNVNNPWDFKNNLHLKSTWQDLWNTLKLMLKKESALQNKLGLILEHFNIVFESKNQQKIFDFTTSLDQSNVTLKLNQCLITEGINSATFNFKGIASTDQIIQEIIKYLKTFDSKNHLDVKKQIHLLNTWIDFWKMLETRLSKVPQFINRIGNIFEEIEWTVWDIDWKDRENLESRTLEKDNIVIDGDYRRFHVRRKGDDNYDLVHVNFKNLLTSFEAFNIIKNKIQRFNENNPLDFKNSISDLNTWLDVWNFIKKEMEQTFNSQGLRIGRLFKSVLWTVNFQTHDDAMKLALYKDSNFNGKYRVFQIKFADNKFELFSIYFKNIKLYKQIFDKAIEKICQFSQVNRFNLNRLSYCSTFEEALQKVKEYFKNDNIFNEVEWISMSNLKSQLTTFNFLEGKTYHELKIKVKIFTSDTLKIYYKNIKEKWDHLVFASDKLAKNNAFNFPNINIHTTFGEAVELVKNYFKNDPDFRNVEFYSVNDNDITFNLYCFNQANKGKNYYEQQISLRLEGMMTNIINVKYLNKRC